ncbi:hypothetical protein RB195_021367 [Necator americanus]|uniref:Histidine acid phosphatase n=1 Tax=Necator americanus TaxID=51031 RepID=A0ABR1EB10_NECAM
MESFGYPIFLSLLSLTHAQSESSLQFVELWFRHGERLPTHYVQFPNDPPPVVPYTEAEAGELTNRGIQQAYQRGEFIRKNYGNFLGNVYRPSQISVWTGVDNRTVTSAQAVLSGAYKPDKDHKWSTTLNWQPIATHTDPTIDWVSTGITSVCPVYEDSFYVSTAYQDILTPFDPSFIQFLENKTGVAVESPIDFNHIIDSLYTKVTINDPRIPYPEWAESIRDNLTEIRTIFHKRMVDAQNDTAGKYHAELFLSYIEDHLNRPELEKNKAVFVSGHDTNFLALGRHLNITPISNKMVSYAALLAVELHSINGTHIVKIYLSSSLEDQPQMVEIAQCKNPCKLETLQTLLKDSRLSRVDWELACRGYGPQIPESAVLTGSMLILLAVFIVSTVILASTLRYDPYNEFSYVALNKQRRGEVERRNSEKLENRYGAPAVKKIYVKANGDPRSKRPKLFIWRKWQSPTLADLRSDVGPYVGLESAEAIYDIPDSDEEYEEEYRESLTRAGRNTSMSAPEMFASRQSIYDNVPTPLTPPPKPYQSERVSSSQVQRKFTTQVPQLPSTSRTKRTARRNSVGGLSDWDEYEKYYRDAIGNNSESPRKARKKRYRTRVKNNNNNNNNAGYARRESRRYYDEDEDRYGRRANDGYTSNDDRYRVRNPTTVPSRSRSANDDFRQDDFVSDFDTDDTKRKDRQALAKHKQKYSNLTRSTNDVIYNRRDQTHPDAYIIYVFLNGQGMECQHMHFQKKQLAKGMNYVLELIARRFNVNPSKLCDMDGHRIAEPSQLMSRGAYVLVAAGQSFRDTWYFLPDNAIDTSSDRDRIEERNDQRDRLLQRRERRERTKLKSQKSQHRTQTNERNVNQTVTPGRRFGNTYS